MPLDLFDLRLDVGRLRAERRLVHRAAQEGVQEAILHGGQLGAALPQPGATLGLCGRQVGELGLDGVAQPGLHPGLGDADAVEFRHDHLFHVGLAPAEGRVVPVLLVVPALVVDVDVAVAVEQLAPDVLAGDCIPADPAAQDAAGEHDLRVARAAVPALEDVLAGIERAPLDHELVPSRVDLAVAHQIASVEAVGEDVRERRAVEPGRAGPVDVPFGSHLLGEALERVLARGEQFEEAGERLGIDRVRLHGLVLVGHVDVAVGRVASRPALAHLLVHALQDLGAQVVGVVLGNRRHHIERQRPGRARPELVVHEGELHTACVLEFLEPDGVAHVAADAVELVREDRLDAFALGAGPDPLEHLVERDAFRATLGRLGHDELPQNRPAVLLRPVAAGAELGVDGVALALLAGRAPRPDHNLHHFISLLASRSASANRPTFTRISTASSPPTARP